MKRLLHILPLLLLAVLLSAGACQRLPEPVETEGYGTLTLQIGPGVDAVLTKSEPDPKDGEVFHNILVIVADKDGVVMDKVYKEYPCTEALGNIPPNQAGKNVTATDNDWIYFVNLKVGYYHVYAYANIEEPDWQIPGETIEDIEKALVPAKVNPDNPGTVDPNRQFATLNKNKNSNDNDAPEFPDHCMLLTGHDELYVGVDPYIGRIDLYRPVVKFEVILDNHTPYPIQLTDLNFNKFNASDSYLIGRKDADGNPVIPDGNSYRELPAFSGPANIPSGAQATVYRQLLYENRIGQDYRMFAKVRFANPDGSAVLDESGQQYLTDDATRSGNPLSRNMTSATIRRVPYEDIRDMANGASMNVLMVTPNTGNGGFLGYKNTPSDQRIVFYSATYNFEDSFRSKAEALLKDKEVNTYYQLRLYKDANGKYHIFRDTRDLLTLADSSIDGVSLTKGDLPTNYPISKDFTGSLCRFTNGNKSLFYNELKLKFDGNADYGNRMWTFYEIHPEGTVLKLIDRETSRVSTLTHMIRGQKLTAVMNVYFEAESGEFTFSLDNAYWEEGHNPKHMFK